MYTIKKVENPEEKSRICNAILRALPDWFAVESSIQAYTKAVADLPVYAAYIASLPIGFIALREHTAYSAEILIMGILQEYHRKGIGAALIAACEKHWHEKGGEFLTVKTLDASREDENYARTRLFYLARGFRPLEVFPLYWNKENPCLYLAKYIA